MLLRTQVAAGHQGGVLRSGGGGEQCGEEERRLGVLQPLLPHNPHVSKISWALGIEMLLVALSVLGCGFKGQFCSSR